MQTLQSRLLSQHTTLLHAFTGRKGGQSRAPYNEANLAFHVGDNAADVLANHQALAKQLGYERAALVHMRQIHSCDALVVDEHYGFENPPECDALITDRPNLPLMVMVADCTPILLYEPNKRVIAAIHAGRAGAFGNIVAATLARMREEFGCDAAQTVAVLGPSIHACCYEVGKEIAAEASQHALGYAVEERGGRYYLDVNAIITKQLSECGVDLKHIEVMAQCSACRKEELFSYRAEGGITGRMAGVIMLR